jgi:hypothetical protein
MDNNTWLESSDPYVLLAYVQRRSLLSKLFCRSKTNWLQRKLRLLLCACCRLEPEKMTDICIYAIDIAEHFADGLVDHTELRNARLAVEAGLLAEGSLRTRVINWLDPEDDVDPFLQTVILASLPQIPEIRFIGAGYGSFNKALIVRDLFPNPFRRIQIDPAWVTGNGGSLLDLVLDLYRHRRFDRVGLLAEALASAGCRAPDVLEHCENGRPHWLGCWVLDALIEKAREIGAPCLL